MVPYQEAFERLSAELEKSPIDVDGAPAAVWVINIRDTRPPGDSVVIQLGVTKGVGNQTELPDLGVAKSWLDDLDALAAECRETARQAMTGELPKGTRKPL
jgi:hypothetical protein